ncbi:MAG: hypothetical protein M3O30_04020 [Planctomycetota bacterium]|nr:hypothetical protein [Planctomycetota bacterium]
MKKLFSVLVLLLALNFLALVGALGWLVKSGHLDKARIGQVKSILFPVTDSTPQAALKETTDSSVTHPAMGLDQLMALQTGRPASEQVEFIQHTFDAQRLELDRRQRELTDLKLQVDLANQKLSSDRAALEKEKKALTDREQESARLATDKGFQDSLELYNNLPSPRVKTIFLALNEGTVQQYLEAMQPRVASKIIKEFKTPEEIGFIQRVLERIRLAQASTSDGKQP